MYQYRQENQQNQQESSLGMASNSSKRSRMSFRLHLIRFSTCVCDMFSNCPLNQTHWTQFIKHQTRCMLPVGHVLCWNPPTWFPWKASGGQFQHDIIWPHDPPVHSMVRLGPKAMPHLFLRPAPPAPNQRNRFMAVPRLYPYSTSAVSHWFHRESLFSSCLPTRCKAAMILLDITR